MLFTNNIIIFLYVINIIFKLQLKIKIILLNIFFLLILLIIKLI